jgi:hypothetical protein
VRAPGTHRLPTGTELLRLLQAHRSGLVGNANVTQQERREIAGLWWLYELCEPPIPRCHLCRARYGIAPDARTSLWWCVQTAACDERARKALGAHREEADEEPEDSKHRAPRPGRYEFCWRHRSWFCPCVAPHLYARDPVAAARWDARPDPSVLSAA